MKIVKYLVIVLLLFGCSGQDIDLANEVDKAISRVNETEAYKNHNHKKGLLSYYLPKDVGVKRSNQISTVMLVDNFEVFMALNVSEIMSQKLEVLNLDTSSFVVVKNFETINNKDETINNTVVIEQLADNQYLLYLKSKEMFFISSIPKASIENILEKMIIISRTVNVDKKKVIAQFSNKEEMNFEREVIELFSESVPEEGFLKDIYESGNEDD